MKFRYIFCLLIILFTYRVKSQSIIPNSPAFTMFTVANITHTSAELSGSIVNFSTHISTLTQNISQNLGIYNSNTGQTTYPNLNLGYNFKIVPTVTISTVQPGGVYQFVGDTLRISPQNFIKDTLKFNIKLTGLEPNVAYSSNYNLQGFYIFGCDTATNNRLSSYANILYSQSYAPTAYNYNNPPPKFPLGYSASFSQSLNNYGYPPQVIFTTSVSTIPKPQTVVPDIIYSSPPPYYLNPQVYGADTLGVDSIFDITNSSAKIAFHFRFVDLSKRLNFNLVAGKSFTLRPIAGNFVSDETTITGNTITINKSNFSDKGEKINFIVSMNGIKPTNNNLVNIFYAVNIFSNPKEGVFAGYQTSSNLLNIIPAAPNFTFVLPAGKIQGNSLPLLEKIVCVEESDVGGMYNPGIISAPAPTGGYGNYKYLWQKRNPGGLWEDCASSGNGGEDYVIQSINVTQLKSTEEYYRRIVTSSQAMVNKVYSDTSNSFKVVYISDNNLPFVTIEQVGVNGKAPFMQIITNHQNSVLHYNITDIDYRNNSTAHTQYSQYFTITNSTTAYEHSYNISIKFSGTCPVLQSEEIYVSKPDGNGNIYPAIRVQNQYWMINNLRATRFNDGTPITSLTNTITQTKASYVWYNNDSLLNALSSGALYNATVINNNTEKNVCPVNWRVAEFSDWDLLVKNTGGYQLSGDSLKLPMAWSGLHRSKPSINFNATPSGEYTQIGNGAEYNFVGKTETATWWGIIADLKVDPPKYNANYFEITNSGNAIILTTAKYGTENDKVKHSIRCVTNVVK